MTGIRTISAIIQASNRSFREIDNYFRTNRPDLYSLRAAPALLYFVASLSINLILVILCVFVHIVGKLPDAHDNLILEIFGYTIASLFLIIGIIASSFPMYGVYIWVYDVVKGGAGTLARLFHDVGRVTWEPNNFSSLSHFRFKSIYLIGLLIICNEFWNIAILSFAFTISETGIATIIAISYPIILMIIIVGAASKRIFVMELANNEEISDEYRIIGLSITALVATLILSFALSIESKSFWEEMLPQQLFSLFSQLLIIPLNEILYIFYFIEAIIVIRGLISLNDYRRGIGRRRSSRDLRKLQAVAVGFIIVSLGIITHWSLLLLYPWTIARNLIGIAIPYTIGIASIDWVYVSGERIVQGPRR